MCTWFYAERSTLSPIITKARQLPLADTIAAVVIALILFKSLFILVNTRLCDILKKNHFYILTIPEMYDMIYLTSGKKV